MIGVLALMVALMGAILGSWALSTDVNDVERTTYTELTDITPLFGSDNAPQYTQYNPSANYTGYYTDDSTIGNVKYFAGVDFTESARPNTYKLNLAPTGSTTGTADLSAVTSAVDTLTIAYYENNVIPYGVDMSHLTIPELVTALNLSGYDTYVFKNPTQPVDWTDTDSFITFTIPTMVDSNSSRYLVKDPSVTDDIYITMSKKVPASSISNPILAASYDTLSNRVTLYYDIAMTQKVNTFDPSDVNIFWGGSNGSITFGNSIDYVGMSFAPDTYMDPSKGVELI